MKTMFRIPLMMTVLAVTAFLTVACGGGSSDSGGSSGAAAAASAISMGSTASTVAPTGTVYLAPTGGTPPYTFSMVNNIGGTLTPVTGTNTALYTAPSTGGQTQQIQIMDSSSSVQTVVFSISVTGTGTGNGVLVVSPLNGSVGIGGQLVFSVSGGSAPYTATILSGGGSFSADTFIAPAVAQTVTVQFRDALGNTTSTSIFVTSSSTTTGTCDGTYNVYIAGTAGTMMIVENSSGTLAGNITLNGSSAAINGSCSGTTISFTNQFSGSMYTGTVDTGVTSGKIFMQGTFTDIYSQVWDWSATQQ